MKTFLLTAVGVAVGTLICTALLSSTHEPDWYRAAFVGLFSGVCGLVWPRKKDAPADSGTNSPAD
ncbi:MAG: hypothetical protein AB1584_01970 [Pseudomonadota bacterium]